MAIIGRSLGQPLARAEMWPSSAVLAEYEKQLGWPQVQAAPQHNMLHHIPGACVRVRVCGWVGVRVKRARVHCVLCTSLLERFDHQNDACMVPGSSTSIPLL
jgi:hypothetical protein